MQPSPWHPTTSSSPTSVMLVEDDRRLAELVSDYLHQHGFAVQHIARGDLAGAACRQHAPELVVLDLMLPGLGGIDVCRQIRSFSDVPILMLTACEDDIEQVLGLESGADDYVHKPHRTTPASGPAARPAAPPPRQQQHRHAQPADAR